VYVRFSAGSDHLSLILPSFPQHVLTNPLAFSVAIFGELHDEATLVLGVGHQRIPQFLMEFRLQFDFDCDYSPFHTGQYISKGLLYKYPA
jgi:hypothetical protein